MADITKTIKFLLLGDDTGATKALKNTSKGFGNTAKSAEGFAGKAKAVGVGVAAVGAAAVVAGAAIAVKFGQDSVDAFKKTAGEVGKLKRVTGESAEDASRLAFAMKQSGVDVNAGTKAMQIFAKNVEKSAATDQNARDKAAAKAAAIRDQIAALEKAGPASAGYAEKMGRLQDSLATATSASKMNVSAIGELGIQYTDANGKVKPMAELMPAIADKFKEMPDGTEKTALAMKLFGKSGTDMLPFLNKGSAGLAELAAKSDAFGNTIGDKQLNALKESKQAQRDWDAAMQGLQVTLGGALLPILTQGAKFLNSVAVPAFQSMAQWIGENSEMFDALGNMMRWVWNKIFIPVIKLAIIGMTQWVKITGQAIEAAGHLSGNKDMEAFGKGVVEAAEGVKRFGEDLKEIPDQVAPEVKVTDTASPQVVKIQTKIDSLKGKLVKAEASGDTKEVEKLQEKINKLEGKKVKAEAETAGAGALDGLKDKIAGVKDKKVDVEAHVKKTGVTEIKLGPSKKGDRLTVVAMARGGRSRGGITLVGEEGPELVDLPAGAYVHTAARTAAMARAARMASPGSSTSSAGDVVKIHLTVNAAPGQQPLEVWRTFRDGLLELKTSLGGRDLGIA